MVCCSVFTTNSMVAGMSHKECYGRKTENCNEQHVKFV